MCRHEGIPSGYHLDTIETIVRKGTDCPPKAGRADAPNKLKTRWEKRAEAKAIDTAVSRKLWRYVKDLSDKSPLHANTLQPWVARYSASSFCSHSVKQEGDHIQGGIRCKSKWCRLCSRVKAGSNWAKYGRQLSELPELHFVTLTTGPRATAAELGPRVDEMYRVFRKVYRKLKDTGLPLAGFRSFETTHEDENDTYHPHFHILISGKEQAVGLLKLWNKAYGDRISKAAQECRVVLSSDREKVVQEIFKYTHKTVTNKEVKSPHALHHINVVTFGRQMFVPFGIKAAKQAVQAEDEDMDTETTNVEKADWLPFREAVYHWDDQAMNWLTSDGHQLVNWNKTKAHRILHGQGPPDEDKLGIMKDHRHHARHGPWA